MQATSLKSSDMAPPLCRQRGEHRGGDRPGDVRKPERTEDHANRHVDAEPLRLDVDDARDQPDGGVLLQRDQPGDVGYVAGELRDEGTAHDGPREHAPASRDGRPGTRGRATAAARAVGIPDETTAPVAAREGELAARRRGPELPRRRPVRVWKRE